MTLVDRMTSLRLALAGLREAISALEVTMTEDQPSPGGSALADRLLDAVTDLAGTLDEAAAQAAGTLQESPPENGSTELLPALCEIHGLLDRFYRGYVRELAAYDAIAPLLEMGRERGQGWREWSRMVKLAIERCAEPAATAAAALRDCWCDVAGELGRTSPLRPPPGRRDAPLAVAGRSAGDNHRFSRP